MNENRPTNESEPGKPPESGTTEPAEPATTESVTHKPAALLAILSAVILLIVVISAPQSSKDRTSTLPAGGVTDSALPALHETPRDVADVTLSDGEGKETSLDAFKGQVVVVNFWATWCAPCIRELPSLMRLREIFKDRNLALMAISQDLKGAEAVVPFLEKNGLSGLPVFYDPKGAAARALGVSRLPTTLFMDTAGREAGRFEGAYEWDQPEILELLEELTLLEKPAGATTVAE